MGKGKGRAPCCDRSKVKRGPWSPAEDLKLITFIQKHGHDNWRALPKLSGLLRCGKSCRLRWINYLRPDVKRGNFTKEEEEGIIDLHRALGNKWSKIASHFPGRTDNEIKNVWNTHLKKRSLSPKDNNNPSGYQSKDQSSATTSSSSSSVSSVLSSLKRNSGEVLVEEESDPKRVRDCYKWTSLEKINDDDECDDEIFKIEVCEKEFDPKKVQVSSTISTTSSDSYYGSNVSNGATSTIQIDGSGQGDDKDELFLIDDLLLDFKEPCDVGDMLFEVNKPEILEEKPALLSETPNLEADKDFWDMLDKLDTSLFLPDESIDLSLGLEASEPRDFSNFTEGKNVEADENKRWFRYLETELGLGETETANEGQINAQVRFSEEKFVPKNNFRSENEIVVKPESDSSRPEFSPSSSQFWPL